MAKKKIARYEIQSEIGRGGMAAVYLAHDPNFRRNVAVKLVAGNLEHNEDFRERFEREARLIARIEHPAIVPVYDFGEHNGQLYLVMRYMQGGTLADKIKKEIFTLRDATQLISQIAPALDAVHSQGIVHRDLKPGNILFDNFGNPAISDFGIAHFSTATSDLTGSAIIGTPSYMSPEQVRADAELDGRSDLYALGVILFEMLTGHGPFRANTPMSVALKHLTDALPSIRTFRPDLPTELESILSKALAKNRDERFASASELARALQTIPESHQGASKPILVKKSSGNDIATEVDAGDASAAEVGDPASRVESDRAAESPKSNLGNPPSQSPTSKISSRGKFQIASAAGLIIFLFIACGAIILYGAWAGFFRGQNATPTNTTTTTQPTVLFADDFSDPNSGWPTIENAQAKYSYQPDGYHILVYEVNSAPWAKTGRQDSSASIYVDAAPVSNSNGFYGLLCRIQDNQNFYYFIVQNNGVFAIGKSNDGVLQPLAEWTASSAIHQGNQTNRLRADCFGNTLRFYANDVLLGTVSDTDFTTGYSGIIVNALDTQGFEVVFNNFQITEPSQ
ncbi:MAG TPA: serine/threonine-protein kinase [Anaerolineales bacterium]|jgi:serine/threonine protein kinase|nr:serine/threonine-protein kinase [Anaerolineales bacterium]HQX16450.1 serine/threonine-protein kinase [Anaerolineales bacterium]